MYLISLYFDEISDRKIRSYMKQIARHAGNEAMIDGKVPPHITVAAFNASSERLAVELFEHISSNIYRNDLQWVSVGTFLPGVIYIAPVLNEYLQIISESIYKEIKHTEGVDPKGCYGPYEWFPHATLGKHLDKEQMRTAFKIMQDQFAPFTSQVVKCGLARTNPYTDIEICELKNILKKI